MSSLRAENRDLDRWLDREVGPRLSLCPGRVAPTSFRELLSSFELPPPMHAALTHVTERLIRSIAEHYPDNVFWDLDRLVASLARRSSPEVLLRTGECLERLMKGFGIHSEIRFRYVHDFTYGFDWAKWVARDAHTREGVGPFDDVFLSYLEQRQGELVQLIAEDDDTYGQLEDDRPRNPFAFSRDPRDERRLHEALAASDWVPVETWTVSGRSRWGAQFADERNRAAKELGLAR